MQTTPGAHGFDIDLAADLVRLTNRFRDALVSVSPGLLRAVGRRSPRLADEVTDAAAAAFDARPSLSPEGGEPGQLSNQLPLPLPSASLVTAAGPRRSETSDK